MFKIVLIDDDIHTIEGIKKHIPFNALELELVAVAYNGKEGLEAIKKHQPDIIFSDIQMPYMTGFEMLECLQELPFVPQIIMFTGFNDFDNAKHAIDANVSSYLVKPATPDEIIAALKKAIEGCNKSHKATSAITQEIVENLLNGHNYTTDELNKSPISLEDKYFCCMQLSTEQSISEIKNILERFKKKFTGDYNIYNGMISGNRVSILLASVAPFSTEQVKKLTETIIAEVQIDIFVTIGTVTDTVQAIQDSYKKCCNIQKYSFCFNNTGCISVDYINNLLVDGQKSQPCFDKKQLFTAVFFNKTDTLTEIIKNTEDTLIKNIIYEPSKIKALIFEFCSTIVFHGKESALTGISEHDMWLEINAINSHKELFEYCRGIIELFKKATTQKNPPSEEITVELMLKYIEENYMNPISLVSLSRSLFCTRSYLRIIFKKHIGVNFKNYLQDFRMKKAGELLLSSQDNFSVIAERVGYHDMKTFRSVFFNHYGMLPSEYRQKNLN